MAAFIQKLLTASRTARLYQLEHDLMADELNARRQHNHEEDIARQLARIDELTLLAIHSSTLHR